MSDPFEYVRTLSPEQKSAALTTQDPVMIVAGAGSGKTRTLVGRMIHLLSPEEMGGLGADPASIMMVTFTNKAAREMRERVAPVIEELRQRNPRMQMGEPWIGTFHGLSLRILRIEGNRAGLGANFSIFDESDARGLANDVAENLGLEAFDVDTFFRDLERAKSRLLGSDILSARHFEIQDIVESGEPLPRTLVTWRSIISKFETPDFPTVYAAYQGALQDQNAVDFSDLMNRVTKLFQENEDIRDSWRSSFRHFMVDEVQDINRAQAAWLDALTDGARPMAIPGDAYENAHANAGDGLHEVNTFRIRKFPRPTVAFVGDDDQSIYAFRGSEIRVMRGLEDRFPGLQLRFLRESYRCQPAILHAANVLVANNSGRYGKDLQAADPFRKSQRVLIEEHVTPEDEIRRIAAEATAHIAGGGDPAEFAVLVRTRDLVKAVARELRAKGLPVSEGKASDIRKSAEVRDAMSFAGFIVNPDAEVLLKRIINKPARGLGPTSMARVVQNAREKHVTMIEELRSIMMDRIEVPEGGEPYKPAFVRSVRQFGQMITRIRAALPAQANAAEAIRMILDETGYLPEMKKTALNAAGIRENEISEASSPREFLSELLRARSNGSGKTMQKRDLLDPELSSEDLADKASHLSEAARRIGNIAILLEQAEGFPTLEAFMQEATLEMSQTEAAAGIQIMTVHASKGLEFDKVRLPFWMEGVFPHARAEQEGEEAIGEERRLAYVAITRAREDVRISRSWRVQGCPFIRLRAATPSRFLNEMRPAGRDVGFASIRNNKDAVYRMTALPATPVVAPATPVVAPAAPVVAPAAASAVASRPAAPPRASAAPARDHAAHQLDMDEIPFAPPPMDFGDMPDGYGDFDAAEMIPDSYYDQGEAQRRQSDELEPDLPF